MTVVPPVKVFAPVSESAPAPALVRTPAPSMMPAKAEDPLWVMSSDMPLGTVTDPQPANPAAEMVRFPAEVVRDEATMT